MEIDKGKLNSFMAGYAEWGKTRAWLDFARVIFIAHTLNHIGEPMEMFLDVIRWIDNRGKV